MLHKFHKLKAKVRKKVRPCVHTPPSLSEKESFVNLDRHSARGPPTRSSSFDEDPAFESVRLPLGTIDSAVEVGAATTAGVELHIDEQGSGNPVKVRKNNQDCFGILPRFAGQGDGLFVGVYDGHGHQGGEVAYVARQIVPEVMEEAVAAHVERCGGNALKDVLSAEERRRAYFRLFTKAFGEAERALRDVDRQIIHEFAGTTATCVWVEGEDVFAAWVGDSRCILGRRKEEDGGNDVVVVDLTWDQKPARDDEKKRVRGAGGRVTRWKKNVGPQRVWLPEEWVPGLAMTRSIGDTCLTRFGVTSQPEVTMTKLSSEESFLVVASDGVWEFMTSMEVALFVAEKREKGLSAEETAKQLVREAMRRWTIHETVVDDTTAAVIFVERQIQVASRKSSFFVGRSTDSGGEHKGLREVFSRSKRTGIPREAQIGRPWQVLQNGKLEAFHPRNHKLEELES